MATDTRTSELSKEAEEVLKAAESNPQCLFDSLPDDQKKVLADRCTTLFKWFSEQPVSSYSDLSGFILPRPPTKDEKNTVIDENMCNYVHMRYMETNDANFEKEFNMNQSQMVVCLLNAVVREKNKSNIDFAPICSVVNLDRGTFFLVKQHLVENPETPPADLVVATFCTPLDICICLTMALAELSSWPLSIVWEDVEQAEVEWCMDDIKEFEDTIKRQLKNIYSGSIIKDCTETKQFKLDSIEKELDLVSQTIEKSLDGMKSAAASLVNKDFESERTAIRTPRDKTISEMISPEMIEKAKEVEQMTEKINQQINHTQQQLDIIRKVNEFAPSSLKTKFVPVIGSPCLVRKPDDFQFVEGKIYKEMAGFNFLVDVIGENGQITREKAELGDIAITEVPMYDETLKKSGYTGLRVAALVMTPWKLKCWRAGTIGAHPTITHGQEFLIFFDDGFEQYVKSPLDAHDPIALEAAQMNVQDDYKLMSERNTLLQIFPLARQSLSLNGLDIDKRNVFACIRDVERRRFIAKYFLKYPDWPLVRMKKPTPDRPPQIVDANDRNKQRRKAMVVHVDRSLCVLRFPPHSNFTPGSDCHKYPCTENRHIHNDECVFRGSPRIVAVNLEDGNNNMSARRMAKNRSIFDVVEPEIAPMAEISITDLSSRTARKSSIPVVDQGLIYFRRQMNERERQKRTQKEQKYSLESLKPPTNHKLKVIYHDVCSSECLLNLDRDPLLPEFHKASPLFIPIACGWKRTIYTYDNVNNIRKNSQKNYVLYRAPCGRSFLNMEDIESFLRATGSALTIDLFCFSDEVDPFKVVVVPPGSIRVFDFTNKQELIPIAAVNTIDQENPPPVTYGARRFPADDRVDVSTIAKGFCSGCTCEDDCSDPNKCECQLLTAANVKRLATSFAPKIYGYGYRYLKGRTISGIFECNDNCGCNRKKCFNRVVQNPIKYPLQLFKTAERGWGVRTLVDIPMGAFIANYVGALLTDAMADMKPAGEDDYFADLDLNDVVENEKTNAINAHGNLDVDVGFCSDDDHSAKASDDSDAEEHVASDDSGANDVERRTSSRTRKKPKAVVEAELEEHRRRKIDDNPIENGDDAEPRPEQEIFKWSEYFKEKTSLFVVDAKVKGNIGRFLNHSCDPNTYVQHVLVDTHDLRLPWSAFFAAKHIKAGEELCWNYGYSQDNVDPNRPVHLQLHCQCGAPSCLGRLL